MIARLATALDGIDFGRAQFALNGLLQSEAIAAPSPVLYQDGGSALNIRSRRRKGVTIKYQLPEEPLEALLAIGEPAIDFPAKTIRAKNKRDEFLILH